MSNLDPRLNAYRPDIADIRLAGKVKSLEFSEGDITCIIEPRVALRAKPELTAGFITEALLGNRVRVFEVKDGWAWGQMEKDGYVGYIPLDTLSGICLKTTHRVCVPATYIYPRADLKSQPATRIFLNSQLSVDEEVGDWVALAGGGFVYQSHICSANVFSPDPVAMAEQFISVPYLWGGCTHDGLDCSALVQQSYHACGLECPRDTDMIEQAIGETGHNSLQRGDLIFWDGHIGMMINAQKMIHTNAHHMRVCVESFDEAENRINKIYGSKARFRRPK